MENKFSLRPYQEKIWDAFFLDGYKKILAAWPRRAGKDFVLWNLMIRSALKRVGVYFYCLPTFKQARLVIWDSITNDGKRFPDFIPTEFIEKKNEQEMKLVLKNGSIIQLIGSDTYDTSLVGTNAVMIVFSEFALSDPRAYQFVRPLLNANDGSVLICSTPRAKNHFYDMYQIAQAQPDWFCQRLTVKDTKHISEDEIKKEIEAGEMSQDLADQEYYTSFDKGQEGTVYGKYIDAARLAGRITTVPWDPRYKVNTAFDLGVRDATAIIFFQVIGSAVHLIDYYEQTGKGLEFYVNYLKSKPYTYGKHTAPHDIRVRELGSGMSRIETARQLGLSFEIAPNLLLEDGIEAVRATMPRMLIDERNCKVLVKALENYHYEFDSKRNVYSATPVHDNSSHAADCMRYLCISLPRMRDGLSAEDIEKNYRDAVYGGEGQIPAPFRQPNNY